MHNYTKYTLLAFIKEAVIDNSHAIMNVRTNMHLLPHVECTIMTVIITFLFIIYITIL